MSETMPTYDSMMNPLLQAMRDLGGSGTIAEINNRTIEILGLPDEIIEIIHDPDRGSMTEVEYRLAWTRTYLKKFGLLDNSSRGVWALTPQGQKLEGVDPSAVAKWVREQNKKTQEPSVPEEEEKSWRDELLDTLLEMDPSAFERLVQRWHRWARHHASGRSA
jgi:restriction system protein